MSRFTNIPYDVEAVQWKGEVTPEIEKLFGDHEVAVKTSGSPLLVVPVVTGTQFAKVGEWVIRYLDGEGDFDVLDDEDFQGMYEAKRSPVDLDIGIPIQVVGPGGEGVGEIRVKVRSVNAGPDMLLEAGRQLFGGISDTETVQKMAAMLLAQCDQQELAAIKELITKLEQI